MQTTNIKRLMRLHWEDMLRYRVGQPLLIYIKKKAPELHERFAHAPTIAAEAQRQANVAGQDVKVISEFYLCLMATITTCNSPSDVVSGGMSEAQLKRLFLAKEGFTVAFDATALKLTLSWMDMMDLSNDVLFFGPPQNKTRVYDGIFHEVNSINKCDHRFYQMARETEGDVINSQAKHSSISLSLASMQRCDLR